LSNRNATHDHHTLQCWALRLNFATCVLDCVLRLLAGDQIINTAKWSALCPDIQRKILDHLSLRELAQLAPLRKELHAAARERMMTCQDRLVSLAERAWCPHIIRRIAHIIAHPFDVPQLRRWTFERRWRPRGLRDGCISWEWGPESVNGWSPGEYTPENVEGRSHRGHPAY
jgi:hypothetical protein